MVTSVEVLAGFALIIAAAALVWFARPAATGPVRSFAMRPIIEEYYVVCLMVVVVAGVLLVAIGTGKVAAPGG